MADTRGMRSNTLWTSFTYCLGVVMGTVLLSFQHTAAQSVNGSVRLDYQSTPSGTQGNDDQYVTQQYYIRVIDHLFYKNQLSFTGIFNYRTGTSQRPVEYRPRYEWMLNSYGYGAQVIYEPYSLRRGVVSQKEVNRRWRSNVFVAPNGWPRVSYGWQRNSQSLPDQGTSRDRWDAFRATWSPPSIALDAGYTRQIRTNPDSLGELVEVYRASASGDHSLPLRHRINAGYSFDRTWRNRFGTEIGSQNQHTVTAGLSGQPVSVFNWSAQYNGRFLDVTTTGVDATDHSTDQLASATASILPARPVRLSVTRYFEESETRTGEQGHRSDYWQGSVTAQGRLYKTIRTLGTVYRIAFVGAPEGRRYNDAYFLSFRGPLQRHAEWSSELSLSDMHGLTANRYSGTANIFARLRPLVSMMWQLGYTIAAQSADLKDVFISEEGVTSNTQWFPVTNFSLSGSVGWRRNRLRESRWRANWAATSTYRWRRLASLSVNYNRRTATTATTNGETTGGDMETLTTDLVWWVTQRTTLSTNYSWRMSGSMASESIWSAGLSTQF